MGRYYVDHPFAGTSCGYMHLHRVIEAKSALEAASIIWPDGIEDAQAIPVPQCMLELSDEEVLNYYEKLHEKLGNNIFYKRIMGFLPGAFQDGLPESEKIFRENGNLKPKWYLEKQRKEHEENVERMRKL
jgi:hypothetical protein